jgi:biotin operon repressor
VRQDAQRAPSRLLDGLSARERQEARTILAAAPAIEIEGGSPHFATSFADAALLVVEEGFVVLRASSPPLSRSVVTFDAGPGAVLLPPRPDEVLLGLGRSRATAISAETRDRLVALPAVARKVVEELTVALEHRQEAIANFAAPRHVERVRRKLLQLGRTYGHVVGDGVRIDVPVSHALLAEMIGSSRETVTRAIDALQRDGFVARAGSTYRLLVPAETLLGTAADVIDVTQCDGDHQLPRRQAPSVAQSAT